MRVFTVIFNNILLQVMRNNKDGGKRGWWYMVRVVFNGCWTFSKVKEDPKKNLPTTLTHQFTLPTKNNLHCSNEIIYIHPKMPYFWNMLVLTQPYNFINNFVKYSPKCFEAQFFLLIEIFNKHSHSLFSSHIWAPHDPY